ncbi:deoxyribodipyrimidine photo-lyase [Terrarubrum flagellatum]|uniref:cryptochrome/photolyase family protein n=1 Tax=Terrirubrum flagellatum TaxID=2895980 RepID=UPI0031450611
MSEKYAIVWFRNDLRLGDNPALAAAARSGLPLLCLYIRDEESAGLRPLGGAARWWLHGSLAALEANLENRGAGLTILAGGALPIFEGLAASGAAARVYWNRRYGAAEVALDSAIKTMLTEKGVACESFNGSLLHEPWEVTTSAGMPMKVFTPFWRAAQSKREPASPLTAPKSLKGAKPLKIGGLKPVSLASLKLEPTKPDWAKGFHEYWTRGEDGARERLGDFLDESLDGYTDGRDRPDKSATSRLSPYLRFGEVSPRQIWSAGQQHVLSDRGGESDFGKFASELGWREFSYHLLFHHPDLATKNFQPRFDEFPWVENEAHLEAWQRGRTGYPMVDAGMRELWATGWMHNRVRMITASFLVKHLLIDWREGEQWFWDTLVDADPANNPASWQWVAGSGADAAPYFRIFNPVLQGEKFDPKGDYVRRWIPEIAKLPDSVIHEPWEASAAQLNAAGVALGKTYPKPIVDHAAARERALAAFAATKGTEPPIPKRTRRS